VNMQYYIDIFFWISNPVVPCLTLFRLGLQHYRDIFFGDNFGCR
jgi:hypothetical protein